MDISIDQAKAFCAVVDEGGYTKAAGKLHKSHSALIYLIKSMELQCGFELFNRKAYRNSLTPPGKRVHSKCLELLSKANELTHLCGQIKQGWEPSIKIVFDGALPFDPFLYLYKQFRVEKVPTIIQTYTGYLDDVEEVFYHLKADIMISILPLRNRELKPVFLRPIKSHLVAHKDHPIHQRSHRWSLTELQDFDFLTIRGSDERLGLNTNEFEKSASFFLSDFASKKEAMLKKTGFGWLPHHMIEWELKTKTLVPIKWERSNVHQIQPILYTQSIQHSGPAKQMILESLMRI